MNRYFVSYFFTDKNERQGYGRAEDEIAEEEDFKEVIITNFIKL